MRLARGSSFSTLKRAHHIFIMRLASGGTCTRAVGRASLLALMISVHKENGDKGVARATFPRFPHLLYPAPFSCFLFFNEHNS